MVRSSGAMRGAIGQVGFQVQDLVVQLQSGTPILTAFVQQGSQIASAFGPAGIAIGTVGTLVAVAAGALLGFNREAAAAEPVLDTVVKSFNAAEAAAKSYGEALRGATAEQKNLATQTAAVDVQSARAEGSDALSQLFDLREGIVQTTAGRRLLTDAGFLTRLSEGPGSLAGLPVIGSERDLRGEVEAAIAAGKADDVSRLLREAGLLDSPQSIELATAAIAAANRVAVAQGIASGEAAAPRAAPPPGGLPSYFYGSGVGGYGKPAGVNPVTPTGVPAVRTGSSAATLAEQARREAEQVARAREEAAARLQAMQIQIAEAEAEATGKAYAEKYNATVEPEIEAGARRQADLVGNVMKTTLDSVQSGMTQFWDDLYSGGLKGAQDYFDQLGQFATSTLANLTSASFMTPVARFFQGGLANGSTLGGLAPSLFGGTQFAGVDLNGLGIATGLGAAGGGLVGTALGGNPMFGTAGGGLGSALGFALGAAGSIGGPAGAALGGLLGSLGGGVVGRLFGGGDPERNNNFQYNLDLATGRTSGQNTKPDQQNQSVVTTLTGQVQQLVEALQGLGGSTAGSINIQAGNRSGLTLDGQRFGSVEELSVAAFRQVIALTSGLDPRVSRAAQRSQATSAQDFISDVQFAANFDRLTGKVGDAAAAAQDLVNSFAEARDRTKELGLSTAQLAAAQRDQLEARASDIQSSFRGQVESAFGYVDSLSAFRDQLRLGRGSPRRQLSTAQSQFEAIAAAAQAGDLEAIGQLQGAASSYLSAGQSVYASGQGFQQIRQTVEAVLNAVIGQGRNAERDLLAGIADDQNTVADLTARLAKGQDDLLAALKVINTNLQRALTA